ncbi:alpha/beta-Hydrolase [Glarea lozoyensis ATCC 20868]|uniref:Alpha/beta-Hydrolase n=1 Tax=Glarea lozoyensis (strain ATCC 20868 / MF5171) TaxID=1116229 RepID=S3DYD6_GLAL2|nr:alpha/beta-Hydrolase [Glarea lozoyensis ATCC 20868]EPE31353.1 alpha/beta-Hydrolase [Glarea lozoyensis ATCC 20868]
MFNTAVISVLTSLSVLWFLFRRNHTKQVEPRDQPSIVPSSRPCGLPDLYPVFPRDGLKGNTNVDIIAVHGIETCSPTTWTAYERDEEPRGRKINWLVDDDMLPSVVPNARIWVFDYNSRYSRDAQEVGIKDLGAVFLRFLWDKKHELGTRPIVFIGSCFGGILITQALQMAASESEKYIQLLQYTKGVIFLGTPLRGTRVKSPAEWRVFISAMWDANHEPSTTLLEDLGENSSNLESIVEAFGKSTIKHEIEIRCFYETRTTQILNAVLRRSVSKWSKPTKIMLVERRSACLDCHEQIPLEVPHAMMNKYRGPDDGNFKLVSGRIKEIFQKTQDIQHRTKEQLTCLQSLSRNYREYKDTNPKRVVGTCEWLLGHEKFLKWRDESVENLLWVSADPGCGKSVLSRALVDERLLTPKEPPAQAQSICYFFFKEGDNERCNAVDALCAILHQLFTQRPALLKHVMNDFENNGVKICNMFGTLWDVLVKATTDPDAGQVVCVLDALDECEESTRKALIQKLGELDLTRHEMRTKTKLKFVVTSRPYENIRRAFHSAVPDVLSINLRGEDESEMIKISNEIDLVILDQVPRIARARDIPIGKDIEEILINSLRNMDNRTYLWLHLILDEVRNTLESSEGKLNKLLAEIPSSVDAAYERILNRVTEKRLVRQARTLLHIVVSAERPLTWREMNIVLAVLEKQEGKNCNSEKELELDSRDAFKTKVRNLCGLFVSIIDSKVYLIHQTAREFLLSEHRIGTHFDHTRTGDSVWKQSLLLEDSNRLILNACILYLLLNVFETDPLEGMDEYRYCSQHSFLDYAAKHWASHFREANIREEEALLESILKWDPILGMRQ